MGKGDNGTSVEDNSVRDGATGSGHQWSGQNHPVPVVSGEKTFLVNDFTIYVVGVVQEGN